MTNDIHIHLYDNGKLDFTPKYPLALDDLISVCMTTCLAGMNNVLRAAPEDKKEECQGTLYDFFNVAASKLLQNFAPEMELRPGLTAQAILEAENAIIMRGDLDKVAPGS